MVKDYNLLTENDLKKTALWVVKIQDISAEKVAPATKQDLEDSESVFLHTSWFTSSKGEKYIGFIWWCSDSEELIEHYQPVIIVNKKQVKLHYWEDEFQPENLVKFHFPINMETEPVASVKQKTLFIKNYAFIIKSNLETIWHRN